MLLLIVSCLKLSLYIIGLIHGNAVDLGIFLNFFFNWIYWVTVVNKLHRVQVHNSTTHHLYTVLCVHHPKSSLLPSPFICPWPSSPRPSPWQSPPCCPSPWVFSLLFFLFNSSTSPPYLTLNCSLTAVSLLCIYESVSLLVSAFVY